MFSSGIEDFKARQDYQDKQLGSKHQVTTYRSYSSRVHPCQPHSTPNFDSACATKTSMSPSYLRLQHMSSSFPSAINCLLQHSTALHIDYSTCNKHPRCISCCPLACNYVLDLFLPPPRPQLVKHCSRQLIDHPRSCSVSHLL